MAINIYNTRTMLQAIDKVVPAQTFFRDTFFSNVVTFPTEVVDVDFRKAKRKMAPFVAKNVGGIVIDRQGFKTNSYETPRIAPERKLTPNDLGSRMMGENLYSTRTPEQRAMELLGKDLIELNYMITRTEEWLCREIMLNGKATFKGWVDKVGGSDYVEDEVDFSFTNKETLTSTAVWTHADSDKYGDLKRIRLEIVQHSGINPDVCVMAQNVADMLLEDDAFLKLLDNRRLAIATFEPRIVKEGVTYLGTITSLGLELFVYNEWFIDEAGTETPMIPDDYLIMGRTGMGELLYGAVTQLEPDEQYHTYEGKRIPKVWADQGKDSKMIRMSSRPLPKPEDVDGWYVLKVK